MSPDSTSLYNLKSLRKWSVPIYSLCVCTSVVWFLHPLILIHVRSYPINYYTFWLYMFNTWLFALLTHTPCAAYMHQWIVSAFFQIMTCRLFGTKCWVIVNWNLRKKLQWNFNRSTKLFIHENAYENIVREMTAILSRADELSRWKCIVYKDYFCVVKPL